MVLLELFHQKWTLNIIMQGGKKLTKWDWCSSQVSRYHWTDKFRKHVGSASGKWHHVLPNIITPTILPSGRVWDGQVDQARSRRVLTGCRFPKHNRLTHIEQELEVWLCRRHHHVVAHWVRQSTQVIELSIVCHMAIHRSVRWTCSHCVPNVVKIAFFVLHTNRKLKDINPVTTGFKFGTYSSLNR
jgi:hypothetical protein